MTTRTMHVVTYRDDQGARRFVGLGRHAARALAWGLLLAAPPGGRVHVATFNPSQEAWTRKPPHGASLAVRVHDGAELEGAQCFATAEAFQRGFKELDEGRVAFELEAMADPDCGLDADPPPDPDLDPDPDPREADDEADTYGYDVTLFEGRSGASLPPMGLREAKTVVSHLGHLIGPDNVLRVVRLQRLQDKPTTAEPPVFQTMIRRIEGGAYEHRGTGYLGASEFVAWASLEAGCRAFRLSLKDSDAGEAADAPPGFGRTYDSEALFHVDHPSIKD